MVVLVALGCAGVLVHAAEAKTGPGRVSVRTRVSYGPGGAALSRIAAVTVPGANPDPYAAPEGFIPQDVAASALTAAVSGVQGNVIYVYGKPAAGWAAAGEPAQLVVTNGVPQDGLAASDDAVLAGVEIGPATSDPAPMEAVLFARPGSGWSGTIQQSATLAAPTSDFGPYGGPLLAISSNTAFTAPGSDVYAFNEPVPGWAGTLSPSATLITDSTTHVRAIAAAGNTVAAVSGRPLDSQTLDIFTEPPTGWSGTVRPTAVLPIPTDGYATSVAISGRRLIVDSPVRGQTPGLVVYQEPTSGWSAKTKPITLTTGGGPTLAATGSTAVTITAQPGSDHFCPCTDILSGVSRLSDADQNTTVTPSNTPVSPASGGQTIAATGTDFVASWQGGLSFYAPGSPPSIPTARLTQLNTDKPQLTLKTTGNPAVERLTLRFPNTLHLNTRRGLITITGSGRQVVTVARNTLTIALSKPKKELRLTLRPGAITESTGLRERLHQLDQHPSTKNPTHLNLAAMIYDAAGSRFPANLQFTIS
jgi:hypothetical protein